MEPNTAKHLSVTISSVRSIRSLRITSNAFLRLESHTRDKWLRGVMMDANENSCVRTRLRQS